ncbi:MAG: Pycsar system effector family protein [Pseudomonadota bacterium]
MDEVNHLKWVLERQINWISSADSKLAILGPVPLAMLAISWANSSLLIYNISWADAPLLVSTVVLCVGLFFTKAALTPRLSGPVESNIFFGRIAAKTSQDYVKHMTNQSDASLVDDLLMQIHRNACIASIKHRNISKSIFWLVVGIPIWLLSVAIGA